MQALVLGTAQWGNPYGVTNSEGRLTDGALTEIVRVAEACGISRIDTAAAYGDAQQRLRPWADRFVITTKVNGSGPVSVVDQVAASLASLGAARCDSCLLHDWSSLTASQSATAVGELRNLQGLGLVAAIGVSAYDERDLDRALEVMGTVDIVQVPVNALDRRLSGSEAMAALVAAGARVQARSIFLQGLLAAPSDATLGRHPDVVRFHDRCVAAGRSPVVAALSYVRSLPWVTEVVVGVTSGEELWQVAEAWSQAGNVEPWEDVASSDLRLIDPRLWA